MSNKSQAGIPPEQRQGTLTRAVIVGGSFAALAALLSLVGCSPKSDDAKRADAPTVSNVALTDAQRQHIRLFTVAASSFHKTIETTGTVDFDNDHATSVLAPFSGPVSRLLVAPGDHVGKGAPLAIVDSPDFAAALGAFHKARSTCRYGQGPLPA
jgi:cobalt-zinc-cadmium efflux system membrane fusion protein